MRFISDVLKSIGRYFYPPPPPEWCLCENADEVSEWTGRGMVIVFCDLCHGKQAIYRWGKERGTDGMYFGTQTAYGGGTTRPPAFTWHGRKPAILGGTQQE